MNRLKRLVRTIRDYYIIKNSGLFDAHYYLVNNTDVRHADINPLKHYVKHGGLEGRNPSAEFDGEYYLNTNFDVKDANLNPLAHYIKHGAKEERKAYDHNVVTLLESLPRADNILNALEIFKNYNGSFQELPLNREKIEQSLRIAVVIHAFYLDVLEDIISSIDNIKPSPDLFVSVEKGTNIKDIKSFLSKRGYQNVVIVPVENRGRDVAPFLIEFSELLQNYDLCCKVHGKKSLYSGNDRSDWRQHLYHNLMGSEEIVNDIVCRFAKDEKLGLVFSDNYGMLPYWGYTWLTNKPVVNHLLDKLNLRKLGPLLSKTYIDFPAGTMFWFRPNAIKSILNNSLSYDDFPVEPIPNDGTLAHGIERLFAYIARLNGYDFIELNYKRAKYLVNICHKNFNQIEFKTKANIKHLILDSNYIIFDIFDTLFTRSVFYPDNVFRIVESKIDKKFGFKSDFFNVRKKTENDLRMRLVDNEDVNFKNIYENMNHYNNYSKEIIEFAKECEFDCELNVLRVKPDVKEILDFALKKEKQVIFVSDMYLKECQIREILNMLSLNMQTVRFYISSETGLRKDNGTVWNYLVSKQIINPDETIMIGDNEISDAKLPGDMRIKHIYHLLSEKNSFFESSLGREFFNQLGQVSEEEMLLLGPVINYLFHSPFEHTTSVLRFEKKLTPYEFGYVALAPLLYYFISYLCTKHLDKKIYFFARDGYFLKELFEYFVESKNIKLKNPPEYLLVSRRAVLGAIKKNKENLKNIILQLGDFEGYFSELLYVRIGLYKEFLSDVGEEDFYIKDQKDLQKGYDLIINHLDQLEVFSDRERKNYLTYLKSVGFINNANKVVVDLGYSGTIQNYLHQLTEESILGEYFITTDRVIDFENSKNKLNGVFSDKSKLGDNKNNVIYKYSLILESYLTSDKGQLLYIDDDLKPVYKSESTSIDVNRMITRGVKDYMQDLSIVDSDFFDFKSDTLMATSAFMFDFFVKNRLLDDELKNFFLLEDDFTGNEKLNILDVLESRGL
jgi:predicted HAD superfamily hydrolase